MPIYMDPLITGNPFKHCNTLQELKEVTMPESGRWFQRSPEPPESAKNSLRKATDNHKDYEDPDCYYSEPPGLGQVVQKQLPPPLPPPLSASQKISAIQYSLKHKPQKKLRRIRNWKMIALGSSLCVVSFLFLISLISLILLTPKTHQQSSRSPATPEALLSNNNQQYRRFEDSETGTTSVIAKSDTAEVSPNYLLTLLITKRRVCLLEAGTDRIEKSWKKFREEHIETAHLLSFANLSHSGTPVHPLHFQRYARSLGIDNECHVIVYDRGDTIWATYAVWIFNLFGHSKVSLLTGGFEEWKRLQSKSDQYRTESGPGAYVQKVGNFQAKWQSNLICTFDDMLTNTEVRTRDVVDAQDREEFNGVGTGAVFGHIRSAINIPVDQVFNRHSQHWLNATDLVEVFNHAGLRPHKSIIVYCSTSVRSSMLWFALRKCNYDASIYYGSWPEWLIRAPDFLKIIPPKKH